jgi:hypothetical protein
MFLIKSKLPVMLVILGFLTVTPSAFGQIRSFEGYMKRLNLTPPLVKSRDIVFLNFNTSSNVTAIQASKVTDGFFFGNTSYGSYYIRLKWEHVGESGGSGLVKALSWIGVGATLGIGAAFLPIEGVQNYRLSATLAIHDCHGKLVKEVTKSNILSNVEGPEYDRPVNMASLMYSSLLGQAIADVNRESSSINSQLKTAASEPSPFSKPPVEMAVEKISAELAARLNRNNPLAILEVSGPETSESRRILGELTKYLVNKNYTLVDRHNTKIIERERIYQATDRLDPATAARVREIGARIVVFASWEYANGRKYLQVSAIDIETRQVNAVSTATY